MPGDGLTHLKRRPGTKGEPAQIGIGDGEALGRSGTELKLRWVRGIASSLDDVRIVGKKWKAVFGDSLLTGVLTRTTKGASTLALTVADPRRKILRHPLFREKHEVTLDGLRWRFVKVSSGGIGQPLQLTYEPLVVAELREIFGPHKAFRDKTTRAQFEKRLALMGKAKTRFICPQLNKIQPIKKASEATRGKNEQLDVRGGGISADANLEVKGVRATPAQIDAGERALNVAESLGAPPLAKLALLLALAVESLFGKVSSNWLGLESFIPIDPTDLEASVHGFLTGYDSSSQGAIEYARAHPSEPAYAVCQAIQRSGAGLASNGAGNYGPWTNEQRQWLEAYGGVSDDARSSAEAQRYAFRQQKKESNWKCMNRLAAEVNWRLFESAGWIYYIDELTLLQQKVRLRVAPGASGVQDISFDYDVGKPINEVTVIARAKAWAAPPGTAVNVSDCGPANGVYIVEEIEASLASKKNAVTIKLKRPSKPLREPAPTTKSGSGAGGSLASGGAEGVPAKVASIIQFIDETDEAATTYLWGGGHGSFAGPRDRMDCSGFVSAAVHAAGYLTTPLTSGSFASVFPGGEGEWVTIYGDAKHVLMKVKYADGTWRWAETSGSNPGGGPGWVSEADADTSGKTACHPPGL